MFELRQIGVVESPLTDRDAAPRQGEAGAPAAWIVLEPSVRDALDPRDDPAKPLSVLR